MWSEFKNLSRMPLPNLNICNLKKIKCMKRISNKKLIQKNLNEKTRVRQPTITYTMSCINKLCLTLSCTQIQKINIDLEKVAKI